MLLDLFSKKLPGFSFIDAIYGLTIILLIVGVIYGSINSVLRNHRKAQLITHADRLSQMIMQEVKNREFDENIDSFPETPLTTNIDFGTDEGEDNLIDFDDVDQPDPSPTNMRLGIFAQLYNDGHNKVNFLFDANKLLVSRYQMMDWDGDGFVGGYDEYVHWVSENDPLEVYNKEG